MARPRAGADPPETVGDAVLTFAIGELRKLLGDEPRRVRFSITDRTAHLLPRPAATR